MAARHTSLSAALREVEGQPDANLVVKDDSGIPFYYSRHLRRNSAEELVAQTESVGLPVRGVFWVMEAR